MRRVLNQLFFDLYRPSTIPSMFCGLFPDERYDVFSSPNRVSQLIHRLRSYLEEEGLDIKIEREAGYVKASSGHDTVIRLEVARSSPGSNPISHLRNRFGQNSFKPCEASEHLQVSRSTLARILRLEIKSGIVKIEGQGRNIKYKIVA